MKEGSLADLGAGQGRDSVPLFKLGFNVTAVDISATGLEQIKQKQEEIKTLKEDVSRFDVSGFDYVLTDSIFHFNPGSCERECVVLADILKGMKRGAVFVNCMKGRRICRKNAC